MKHDEFAHGAMLFGLLLGGSPGGPVMVPFGPMAFGNTGGAVRSPVGGEVGVGGPKLMRSGARR